MFSMSADLTANIPPDVVAANLFVSYAWDDHALVTQLDSYRARTVTDATAALRLDATPAKPTRKPRTVRARPPDGLLTAAEAAAKLGCSIKTLNAHVDSGALSYVPIGKGKKRVRRMFTDADLNEFITNQTRKVTPCPSTAGRARPTGTMTFTGEVIDFTGRRKPPTSAKRRK